MQRIEVKPDNKRRLCVASKSQVTILAMITILSFFRFMKSILFFVILIGRIIVRAHEIQEAVIGKCGGGENWYDYEPYLPGYVCVLQGIFL